MSRQSDLEPQTRMISTIAKLKVSVKLSPKLTIWIHKMRSQSTLSEKITSVADFLHETTTIKGVQLLNASRKSELRRSQCSEMTSCRWNSEWKRCNKGMPRTKEIKNCRSSRFWTKRNASSKIDTSKICKRCRKIPKKWPNLWLVKPCLASRKTKNWIEKFSTKNKQCWTCKIKSPLKRPQTKNSKMLSNFHRQKCGLLSLSQVICNTDTIVWNRDANRKRQIWTSSWVQICPPNAPNKRLKL